MEIKKIFLKQILEDTLILYSEKILPVSNVELKYISKETFLNSAKENNLIQMQIKMGVYNDFEKEYPNFLMVYGKDKNPLMKLFDINFKITICDEMAKDKLKPFTKQEVKDFLMHSFAHEVTHIFEDELKIKYPEIWSRCLKEVSGSEPLAKESFAEYFADEIVKQVDYKRVENKLFAQVIQNVKKIRERHSLNK